jgi:hypothetical protein
MSPREALDEFNRVKQTLGEEGYQKLSDQLADVQTHILDMFESPEASSGVASIPAAVAASLILRELQRHYPHGPMSCWAVEHQLRAMYAILAFREYDFFADVYISFASDLGVEHVVPDFKQGTVD